MSDMHRETLQLWCHIQSEATLGMHKETLLSQYIIQNEDITH